MPEPLALDEYVPLVEAALAEDIGDGDATTLALVPEGAVATGVMLAREPLVMHGNEPDPGSRMVRELLCE